MKQNIKSVFLGNNLYPNDTRAKQFGVSKEELAKVFWAGINVDYKKLEKMVSSLAKSLAEGEELHIKSENGTDFKVKIKDGTIHSSDGIISDSDIEKGGPATKVWLPAGEVYLAPVPGTADGIIVDDFFFFGDKEVRNLTLKFEKGKLVSMEADSGIESLKSYYDAAEGDKDLFAFVDFGVNPNVSILPNSKMECYMAAGMVTLGFGNNLLIGGENDATFEIFNHLINCTVYLDGKIIIKNGELEL